VKIKNKLLFIILKEYIILNMYKREYILKRKSLNNYFNMHLYKFLQSTNFFGIFHNMHYVEVDIIKSYMSVIN